MPPSLGWLEELVRRIGYANPEWWTAAQMRAVSNQGAMHADAAARMAKELPLAARIAGENTKEALGHVMINQGAREARSAGLHQSPDVRYFDLPSNSKPGMLSGNMAIKIPGYYSGTPYEHALEISTLGSVEPGSGRALLEALKGKYPDVPWFLESLSGHGTPEFYIRRGFLPRDDTPLSGGANGLSTFVLPEGRMLKRHGGSVGALTRLVASYA